MVVKKQDTYVSTPDGGFAKPRPITKSEAVEKSELYVAKNLTKYLKKLHALAMGITVAGLKRGEAVVYEVPPDRAALETLIERGMGKAPQRHEITGEGGGAVEIIPWLPAAPEVMEVIDVTASPLSLSSPSPSLVQQAEEQGRTSEPPVAALGGATGSP